MDKLEYFKLWADKVFIPLLESIDINIKIGRPSYPLRYNKYDDKKELKSTVLYIHIDSFNDNLKLEYSLEIYNKILKETKTYTKDIILDKHNKDYLYFYFDLDNIYDEKLDKSFKIIGKYKL